MNEIHDKLEKKSMKKESIVQVYKEIKIRWCLYTDMHKLIISKDKLRILKVYFDVGKNDKIKEYVLKNTKITKANLTSKEWNISLEAFIITLEELMKDKEIFKD